LDNQGRLAPGGLILDVAMGLGGNSEHLSRQGFRVIGVDISGVALRKAKNRCPSVQAILGDLTQLRFPPEAFDGILNFYYLDRGLWPEYQRILKPGGMLLIETMMMDMRDLRPEIAPQYLLEPGELRIAFQSWEILAYSEGWQSSDSVRRKSVASLVARKPIPNHE
jgi:SAM-dependent methyltransferase